ncbi:hypothetical protein Tco_0560130, partial [Tanacetum coccineum]
EGLAVVRAEKNSLMATNAEQTLRIKKLEQQLKGVHEVHSSAVKDLECQLAQKDSALVYAQGPTRLCPKSECWKHEKCRSLPSCNRS